MPSARESKLTPFASFPLLFIKYRYVIYYYVVHLLWKTYLIIHKFYNFRNIYLFIDGLFDRALHSLNYSIFKKIMKKNAKKIDWLGKQFSYNEPWNIISI